MIWFAERSFINTGAVSTATVVKDWGCGEPEALPKALKYWTFQELGMTEA